MNFDLHIHFSLKPANSRRTKDDDIPDRDHWNRRFLTPNNFSQPEIIENAYAKVVFGSQSHGQSLKDGNCRIICNSLYPIERGFIKTTFSKFVASLTGVDESILFDLDKMRLSYFQALTNEYENLLSAHRKKRFSDDGGHIVLVNSFGEILKELGKSNDSILVLNSVEGAHAFFEYSKVQEITFSMVFTAEKQLITGRKPRPNTKPLEKLIDGLERNIDRVKTEWKYPPFYVTFAHHYYNHLCGHSKSLSPEIVFQQQTNIWVQDGSRIIDRRPDYVGFRPWGSKILFHLLSRKSTNGDPVRRILIDTKHMSIRARGQFLHTVKDRLQMFDDRIPIIQSHTTVNGRPSVIDTYERSGTAEDEARMIRKERNKRDDVSVLDQDPYYFDNGDLNLFDDEIRAIVESDGIMGLQLDEKRLLGKKLPPECAAIEGIPENGKDLKKKIAKFAKESLLEKIEEQHEAYWTGGKIGPNPYTLLRDEIKKDVSKYKEVFCCLILRNIFRMVEVAGERAWDHICIGSDYEGVINTLAGYSWSENMQELREDLLKVWHKNADHSDSSVSEMYGSYVSKQKRKAMIDKIFIYNSMNFLKKYFNDDYLKWGNLPETGFVLSKEEIGRF